MQNEYHDAPEEYEFLQEKIKDQDTKAQMRRGLPKVIGTGLLFGMCASISFFFMNPLLERYFGSTPEEVEIVEEIEPEDSADHEEKDAATSENQEPLEVTIQMELQNYKELQQILVNTGREVSKSVVTMNSVSDTDLGTAPFYEDASVSGVIVADNNRELLILAKSSVLKKTAEIEATFYGNYTYKAQLKKTYPVLGFSIYTVEKTGMAEKALKLIKVADFAESESLKKGETLLCVGSPFGYSQSSTYGSATNVRNSVYRTDGQYKLISTDINGTPRSSGVLANVDGKIIGIADGSISSESGCTQLFGYEISSLANIIENLSNGKDVPYVGINGYNVTKRMSNTGIPDGVYVDSVDADSPAMLAGIQSGDVLMSINYIPITSMSNYQKVLMEADPADTITIVGMRYGKNGYKEITYKIER